MKWVKFSKDYDHVTARTKTGTPRAMVSYKEGHHVGIPDAHAEAAIAGGFATAASKPAEDKAAAPAPSGPAT